MILKAEVEKRERISSELKGNRIRRLIGREKLRSFRTENEILFRSGTDDVDDRRKTKRRVNSIDVGLDSRLFVQQ